MKIRDMRADEPKQDEAVRAFDIPQGTFFEGNIGKYPDRLFYRAGTHVASLSNAENTWYTSCVVLGYKPLDVEVIIHGEKQIATIQQPPADNGTEGLPLQE